MFLPAARDCLDRCEGHPNAYERRLVPVNMAGGQTQAPAWCYMVWRREGEGPPNPKYLAAILKGARHHGLPEEYIRFLEQLLP